MLTQLKHFPKDSPVPLQTISFAVASVDKEAADVLLAAFQPGYAFEIVSVQHFFGAVTANASYDVKIGEDSALEDPAEPADAEHGAAELAESYLDRRGGPSDIINLHATTDETGALEGGHVLVTIRPVGLRGD